MHGIVGIPVSVRRFVTLGDYRKCFLRIRDKLHARGFATECMFLEQDELDDGHVIERLKKANADIALWLVPDGAEHETPLRLRDAGIRYVGVSLAESSGIPCNYHVRRRDAMRAVLRAWRGRGALRGVVIARTRDEEPGAAERIERLKAFLEGEELDVEMLRVPTGKAREVAEKFCVEESFGLFIPGPAAALLAHSAPEVAITVLGTCRAALIDGPMDLPVTPETEALKVDIVSVDSEQIATEVAEDILSGEVPDETEPKIFTAEPHIAVPLGRTAFT